MAKRHSKDRFRSTRKPGRQPESYFQHTTEPLQNLLFLLPLLAVFHLGVWVWDIHAYPQYPLRTMLSWFGVTTSLLPPLLIIGVLLGQHVARGDPWTFRPTVWAGMLGEGLLWTIPLVAVQYLRNLAAADLAASMPADPQFWRQVVFYVGTGIYEEFVFRLVLISLVMLVLVDLAGLGETVSAVAAVVVSAVLFALAHFGIPGVWEGSEFSWARLGFLIPAGALWGGLMAYRGFAIAVASHAAWNILHLLMS
jgi:membrane protease YdiL (CAAX protease family)